MAVPRSLRIINGLVLVMLVAGAGLYVWAWYGLRDLEANPPGPDAAPFAGMARFDELWLLNVIGRWLVVGAIALAIIAALAAAVAQRSDRGNG